MREQKVLESKAKLKALFEGLEQAKATSKEEWHATLMNGDMPFEPHGSFQLYLEQCIIQETKNLLDLESEQQHLRAA